MNGTNTVAKVYFIAIILFLNSLAVISADITVSSIDNRIKLPIKQRSARMYAETLVGETREISFYDSVLENNIFQVKAKNEVTEEAETFDDADAFSRGTYDQSASEEAATPARPIIDVKNYELGGTIMATPRKLSSAYLHNRKDDISKVYGLREDNKFIDGKYEIKNIARNIVEVYSGNTTVFIKPTEKKQPNRKKGRPSSGFAPKAGRRGESRSNNNNGNRDIRKVGKNSYVIDQRFYASMTEDLGSIMEFGKQINVAPKFDKNKKPIGFEIKRIKSGSLLQRIGVQRGDIIKSVNGKPLKMMSIQQVLSLVDELKSETNINLGISRRNKDDNISYEVR